MRTRILLVALLTAAGCFAQGEPAKAAPAAEPKFYHLDFVVQELEGGKVINSRSYAMTVSTAQAARTQIRMGGRVPVQMGGAAGEKPQYNFMDVGTNIDAYDAKEVGDQLALQVTADVSSIASEPAPMPGSRQVKWSSPVIVPLRRPTVLFSSDDPTSRRQMRLEVTATPIR